MPALLSGSARHTGRYNRTRTSLRRVASCRAARSCFRRQPVGEPGQAGHGRGSWELLRRPLGRCVLLRRSVADMGTNL